MKKFNNTWQCSPYSKVSWKMDLAIRDLRPITGAKSDELPEVLNHMRDVRVKELKIMLKKEFAFLAAAGFKLGDRPLAQMEEHPRWVAVCHSMDGYTITCICEVYLYRPISRRNLVIWSMKPGGKATTQTLEELVSQWPRSLRQYCQPEAASLRQENKRLSEEIARLKMLLPAINDNGDDDSSSVDEVLAIEN